MLEGSEFIRGEINLNSKDIFLNNFRVSLLSSLSYFSLGIFNIIILIYNGFMIGVESNTMKKILNLSNIKVYMFKYIN